MARCKGFDSHACGRLVAHGHNAPPERCSVPFVLRIPDKEKKNRRTLTGSTAFGALQGIRTPDLLVRRGILDAETCDFICNPMKFRVIANTWRK